MRSQVKVLFAVAALFAFFGLATQAPASQKRLHESVFRGTNDPGSVAVDQSGGEVYVVDTGDQVIRKFDSAGNPAAFSALNGQSTIDGSDAGPDADRSPSNGFSFDSSSQVAVDSSGGATDGDIYVADSGHNVVAVFDSSGAYLEQLTGSTTPQLSLSYPCGVAVDPSGNVYISTSSGGQINRYAPAASPLQDSDYDAQIEGVFGCAIAADSTGAVYEAPTAFGSSGPLTKYTASDFGTVSPAGTQVAATATAVAVDPVSNDVLVDEGTQISQLDSTGSPATEPFGQGDLTGSRGVAINSASDRVYASGQHIEVTPPINPPAFTSGMHIFGPSLTVPGVVTGGTEAVEETTVTLKATVDPDGEAVTDCHFEYGTDTSYGQSASCDSDPGSGSGAVDVKAELADLDPSTIYHFRIVAANANGENQGEDATFTTASGAEPQTLYAGQVQATSAVLSGQVNPHNQLGTTYQFEWGLDGGYGNVAPASPLLLGASDDKFHLVTAPIAGLSAGATYHFRLVATTGVGSLSGADQIFTTPSGPAPQPPDRGYEKVSPDAKAGFSVRMRTNDEGISSSGDRAIFEILGQAPDASQGPIFSAMFSSRDPQSGWTTKVTDAPINVGGEYGLLATSPDLSKTFVETTEPFAPGAVPGKWNLYSRDNASGSHLLLNIPEPTNRQPYFGGSSPDFSTVVYLSPNGQLPEPAVPADTYYPYAWSAGHLQQVAIIDPDDGGPLGEEPAPNGAWVGSGRPGITQRAVARDGRHVVFHAVEPGPETTESTSGQIYIRDLGDPTAEPAEVPHTVHVSASQRSIPDPAGPLPATYWTAEPEHASKVLFTSCEKLTDDSTADASAPLCDDPDLNNLNGTRHRLDGRELYLFDAVSGELTDISSGDPSGADVWGVVGNSDDLSRVYFVAAGSLAQGAVPGEPNLYLWESGQTRLIATLSGEPGAVSTKGNGAGGKPTDGDGLPILDQADWSFSANENSGPGGFAIGKTGASRVTPDGSVAVFVSRVPLTGFDNVNPAACGAPSRCMEVYRYDADSAQLACLSCAPAGGAPAGEARLSSERSATEQWPVELPANLSDDGNHVFFETPSPLVPSDSNGRTDVYEWVSGRLRLISSGVSSTDSYFVDATPDGQDALFLTREQLVLTDRDGLVDLYDARIGGGFSVPVPPPPCEGDACQPAPQAPSDPTPASSTASPPAAQSVRKRGAKRCSRGRKLKKGRCVKPRHARKHRRGQK